MVTEESAKETVKTIAQGMPAVWIARTSRAMTAERAPLDGHRIGHDHQHRCRQQTTAGLPNPVVTREGG
jgi:hypothetical protein